MTDTSELHRALLELHSALLREQQIRAQRIGGRMSVGEGLQAGPQALAPLTR